MYNVYVDMNAYVCMYMSMQPNSMGIDPSDEQCTPFYDKMKELDMVHSDTLHIALDATLTLLCTGTFVARW